MANNEKQAMSEMAEKVEAVICESLAWMDTEANISYINKVNQPDPAAIPTGKDGTKPSIVTLTMNPPLSITHFDQYIVDVEIDVPENVTLKTVTLTVTPISFVGVEGEGAGIKTINWNYNVDGNPAENDPTVKVKTGTFSVESNKVTLNFDRIRPDDIYPEIQFAPSS